MLPAFGLVLQQAIELGMARCTQMRGYGIVALATQPAAVHMSAHAEVVSEDRSAIVSATANTGLPARRIAQLLDDAHAARP